LTLQNLATQRRLEEKIRRGNGVERSGDKPQNQLLDTGSSSNADPRETRDQRRRGYELTTEPRRFVSEPRQRTKENSHLNDGRQGWPYTSGLALRTKIRAERGDANWTAQVFSKRDHNDKLWVVGQDSKNKNQQKRKNNTSSHRTSPISTVMVPKLGGRLESISIPCRINILMTYRKQEKIRIDPDVQRFHREL